MKLKETEKDINKKTDEQEREEIIKNTIIERLRAIPPNARLSVGDRDSLDVSEMIKHVQLGDETGNLIIETQLEYIRSLWDLPISFEENEDFNN